MTWTREQSIDASSGSVTTTSYGMVSPHSKKSPSSGVLTWTVGAVFPTVELHPVFEGPGDRHPGDIRNIILVATERAAPTTQRLIDVWSDVRRTRAPGAPDLRAALRDRWDRDVRTADVPLLTDGYAPTDALLLG